MFEGAALRLRGGIEVMIEGKGSSGSLFSLQLMIDSKFSIHVVIERTKRSLGTR